MLSRMILTALVAAALCAAGCDGQLAQTTAAKATTQPAVKLGTVGQFTAVSATAMAFPTHLAFGADGTLYVADTNANAVYGMKDGARTLELTGLDKPLGIAVAGDSLYVGNQGRGTVEVYDLAAKKVSRALDAKFKMPNSIAVAADGVVYVADSLANKVHVFAANGVAETPLVGFKFPSSVAVNDTHVLVGDQGNHRLVVLNRQHTVVKTIGEAVSEKITTVADFKGRFTRIQDIALKAGDILVLDSYHSHIQVLGVDGSVKGFMGRTGLGLALGIAVSPSGEVVASDPTNRRVLTIAPELR